MGLRDADWGAGVASGEEMPLAWALMKASVSWVQSWSPGTWKSEVKSRSSAGERVWSAVLIALRVRKEEAGHLT